MQNAFCSSFFLKKNVLFIIVMRALMNFDYAIEA